MAPAWCNLVFLVAAAVPVSPSPFDLRKALQSITEYESDKYNCSIALAFRSKSLGSFPGVVSGVSDFESGRKTTIEDAFVWGSVTKTLTGASILSLVDKGSFSLDDKITSYVNPILKKMAAKDPSKGYGSTLEELFGREVKKVTIRDLISMKSGIPDFDTAKPEGQYPTDSFRATVYAHPQHAYGPMELLNLPWVKKGELEFKPGYRFGYSSSNFILLGFILAAQKGYDSWEDFDQSSVLNEKLKSELRNLRFAVSGDPKNYTNVHGYDRTSYNNQTGDHDVYQTAGVFSGWTASDLVGTVGDVANLTYEIYGPVHDFVSKETQEDMVPTEGFYGMSTMNFKGFTGNSSLPEHMAWGHLGATYGFQSIVAYFPYIETALVIASSIETNRQDQPADTLCLAYNTILNYAKGLPQPQCAYTKTSYYRSTCNCTTPSF
eukprot:jgi/Bigna1/126934/aug1.3_g1642